MTDQHMLIAVTRHADGSMSARIWPMPADQLDAAVAPLGEPAYRTHTPADVRAKAAPVVAQVRDATVVVAREDR